MRVSNTVLAALGFAVGLEARSGAAQNEGVNPAELGTIFGQVRYHATGKPIKDVKVSMYDSVYGFESPHLGLASNIFLDAKSDPEGRYSFSHLPPRTYKVAVDDDLDRWDRIFSPFIYKVVVSSSDQPIQRDFIAYPTGSVSGRFFWETDEPIVTTHQGYNDYLYKKPGGLAAHVTSEPPPTEAHQSASYRKKYRLPKLSSMHPATIVAVLNQSVGDYYIGIIRKVTNIPVVEGKDIPNINFTFPKFQDSKDRVSVEGRLIYPESLPPYYHKAWGQEAHVAIERKKPYFCQNYISQTSVRSFKLHNVPPGMYKIKAHAATGYDYIGKIEVGKKQPQRIEIILEESFEQDATGAWREKKKFRE